MLNTDLAKQRRAELGLTLAQLGDQIGVTRQVINRWEMGRAEPRSLDTLRRYAKALEVDLEQLVADPDRGVAATS